MLLDDVIEKSKLFDEAPCKINSCWCPSYIYKVLCCSTGELQSHLHRGPYSGAWVGDCFVCITWVLDGTTRFSK